MLKEKQAANWLHEPEKDKHPALVVHNIPKGIVVSTELALNRLIFINTNINDSHLVIEPDENLANTNYIRIETQLTSSISYFCKKCNVAASINGRSEFELSVMHPNTASQSSKFTSVKCQIKIKVPPDNHKTKFDHPGVRALLYDSLIYVGNISNIRFDTLHLATTGGKVVLSNISANNVSASTSSGSITCKGSTVDGNLILNSSNQGSISVTDTKTEQIHAHTKHNTITLKDIETGDLVAETEGCRITCTDVVASRDIKLRAVDGPIDALEVSAKSLYLNAGKWVATARVSIRDSLVIHSNIALVRAKIWLLDPMANTSIEITNHLANIEAVISTDGFSGTFEAVSKHGPANINVSKGTIVAKEMTPVDYSIYEYGHKKGVVSKSGSKMAKHKLKAIVDTGNITLVFGEI